MYEVGHQVKNEISGDVSIFAGYVGDREETWCDVGMNEYGYRSLSAPERKTFEGFNGSWTKWSQDIETFASSVSPSYNSDN